MAFKYNPFRPDKITPPGAFVGRLDEINYIEGCLSQAKNGNPKHFIVSGERGIGKSSLVLLVQYSARGDIKLFKDYTFKFLVVNVSLRKDDTFLSIVDRIAQGLKESERHDAFGAFVFKSLDFLSRIEAAGVRFDRSNTGNPDEEALSSLIDDLEKSILKMGDVFDGIVLLIDEADGPPVDANLGLLCKLITEEMAKRQTDRVCIGLAGLPVLATKLSESHELSLRIFHSLYLKPLEPEERVRV